MTTQGDTGWRLVRKATTADAFPSKVETDGDKSTRKYKIASDMMEMLSNAGSVLVVAGTRSQAQLIAHSLAESGEEDPALATLVDFVRGQLGDAHPLVETLRHSVGFHHAGLPTEVQEALEQAVRNDELRYLTCTSTLTDGVNLPVRTVVIYDQAYAGQPNDTLMRGARLVNAMGRAGRAGKETEGWIVLTRAARPTDNDFADLDPDPDALAVTSSLATEQALESFAALETALRDDQDAIFTAEGRAATDFIGFVWLTLAIQEDSGMEPEDVDVAGIVDSTLAAALSAPVRATRLRVARAVQARYISADQSARRRWPRTGTSIGSAQSIDNLAQRLARTIITRDRDGTLRDVTDPGFLFRFPGVLQTLLGLPEAPTWRFRVSRQGADIEVRTARVLRDWLGGESLAHLAETHLAQVPVPSWRIEQMVDAVTSHFEHYLSWTVGALVELVNMRLADFDFDDRLCPDLGGYIRFGVDNAEALILMTGGIRSRRLVHAIAADLADSFGTSQDNLRQWLASMGIAEWRDRLR